jgi:excinuclease ABC subunit C
MVKDGRNIWPYTSFKKNVNILELIKSWPSWTCNFDLSQSNTTGKFKVCLEYHIGNCKGPCEGHESLDSHMIREILKGNFKESMKDFKRVRLN